MKHAYLIIAHNEFGILSKLIQMLDYSNNDLFIHIDAKTKDDSWKQLAALPKHASLTFTERISVFWGRSSQIDAELLLLREATKTYHDYYHLISGVDLPIQTHEWIEDFFEQNKGKEFVAFAREACENRKFEQRVKYYRFVPVMSSNKTIRFCQRVYLKGQVIFQKILGVNRIKNCPLTFMYGSNWFDITHAFAVYACEAMQKPEMKEHFQKTLCADEVFLQTILYNSEFNKNRAEEATRFVEWRENHSSPEIITMSHWDKIKDSKMIFARKFSEKVDAEIIQKVFDEFG